VSNQATIRVHQPQNGEISIDSTPHSLKLNGHHNNRLANSYPSLISWFLGTNISKEPSFKLFESGIEQNDSLMDILH
jgi:hypothetical protein